MLDKIIRHITPLDEILEKAGGNPFRILHVTLLSGKLLDEVRIDQLEIDVVLQHPPHWHPVDARTFHTDFLHMVLQHFCEHLLEFRSQNSILFLKNDTVFIDNTDEYTIFVNVKTAYLSHRHSKFLGHQARLTYIRAAGSDAMSALANKDSMGS